MVTSSEIISIAENHAKKVMQPNLQKWLEGKKWPRAESTQAAKDGLLGLYCPAEFGGQGLSFAEALPVYEALGRVDGAYAFCLSMHNICSYAICGFASDSFKEKWAKRLTSGEALANFSLTEPQSGSDAANLLTSSTIDSDGNYILNGDKAWVTLADEADVYLVVTATEQAPGVKGAAMVAVEKGSAGLTFGPLYNTPSYNFLPMAEMHMKDVKVPQENVILPPGKGLQGALMAIDIARASIASGCAGLIETALMRAVDYAYNRKMFKGVALDLDGIRWMLSDVYNDLEIVRLLYKKAAESLGGEGGTVAAAHAKLYAPDAALRAATVCSQVMGGAGLFSESDMHRLVLLAQMLKVVDGTTEIQRVVLGRDLARLAKERLGS